MKLSSADTGPISKGDLIDTPRHSHFVDVLAQSSVVHPQTNATPTSKNAQSSELFACIEMIASVVMQLVKLPKIDPKTVVILALSVALAASLAANVVCLDAIDFMSNRENQMAKMHAAFVMKSLRR